MRGSVSYVTMMVLNPIIILFYQNCSVVPVDRAMAQEPAKPAVKAERAPAEASIWQIKNNKASNSQRCTEGGSCDQALRHEHE